LYENGDRLAGWGRGRLLESWKVGMLLEIVGKLKGWKVERLLESWKVIKTLCISGA
jgi:hypothetical protein